MALITEATHIRDNDPLRESLHDIVQPLTALQCSLDVVLLRPRSEEHYRQALEEAQGVAATLRTRLEHLRNLLLAE